MSHVSHMQCKSMQGMELLREGVRHTGAGLHTTAVTIRQGVSVIVYMAMPWSIVASKSRARGHHI